MTRLAENSEPRIQPIGKASRQGVLSLSAAVLSGILLAVAFPPLGWWPMAFVAFMPMLWISVPRGNAMRLFCGYAFGFTHFVITLWWLNSVGFGAGIILAAICACFPAIWYWLISMMLWEAKPREVLSENQTDEHRQCARRLGTGLWAFQKQTDFFLKILSACALWTALEWVRSWFFTGFPWNLVGISQAFAPTRLLATLAGPYGISFVILLVNFLLAGFLVRRYDWKCVCAFVVLLLLICGWCCMEVYRTPELETTTPISVVSIQGNVPECRNGTDEEVLVAWRNYSQTTLAARRETSADMVLWPEGALPCTLTTPEYSAGLRLLLKEIKTPILLGALDERLILAPDNVHVFNSAFLLTEQSPVLLAHNALRTDYYDKIHLVPFGEYVPFSKHLPWLVDFLGMGVDLTPGKEYRLFHLPRKDSPTVDCGVNICFEDVFPEISRRFTLAGSQMLITITNDCWYGTTSGARQHLAHAVFRAVENRRPLLRAGNNSDTCLITHTGKIVDPIVGPDGNPFAIGWQKYEITPFEKSAPLTIYARTGNLFAWLCATASILFCANLARRKFHRKKKMREEINA